jgi:hypothetical protein
MIYKLQQDDTLKPGEIIIEDGVIRYYDFIDWLTFMQKYNELEHN